MDNIITFADTNFLIPQVLRELYFKDLSKQKDGSNRLIDNSKLFIDNINETQRQTHNLVKLIENLETKKRNIRITPHVLRQLHMYDDVVNNIIDREQKYVFTALNMQLSDEVKNKNNDVYEKLLVLKSNIEKLKTLTNDHEYNGKKDKTYFFMRDYLSGLKNFLEISKEDHKFDYGTDDDILASILTECLRKKQVRIISNDGDIAKSIAATVISIESVPLILQDKEEFMYLFKNKPQLYTFNDYSTLDKQDIYRTHCDILGTLKGTDDYMRKLTKFASFVKNSLNNYVTD